MNAEKLIRTVWFGATIFLGAYLYAGVRVGLWALLAWMALMCLLELRAMYQKHKRGW
jgi:hypothetical protein